MESKSCRNQASGHRDKSQDLAHRTRSLFMDLSSMFTFISSHWRLACSSGQGRWPINAPDSYFFFQFSIFRGKWIPPQRLSIPGKIFTDAGARWPESHLWIVTGQGNGKKEGGPCWLAAPAKGGREHPQKKNSSIKGRRAWENIQGGQETTARVIRERASELEFVFLFALGTRNFTDKDEAPHQKLHWCSSLDQFYLEFCVSILFYSFIRRSVLRCFPTHFWKERKEFQQTIVVVPQNNSLC